MNSKDYWQSRSEQNIMSADKSAEELLTIMKESYNQANKLIRNEIDNFYSRFSYNQKISYEETLKRMDKKELKQFREQAWEYYKEAYDKNWETAYTDKMRTLSGRAYMSRLEGLKVNIAYQYQKIAEELNVKLEEGLTKQYEKSFEQTMFDVAKGTGMGLDVTRINSDIVKKTIERKWMSGNYSSRIWENKEKLVSTLNSTLPVLFTLGKSPNECAKVLSDKLDSNYKNCVRLVRTEFTHIANESSADAYKECGIDQYEYLATLDQRTDDTCGELDGKVFKVGDKQVGVNFPPMHPNCRCTTVAHFPDDYTERIAKDEKGKYFYVDPKTTFKDWKEMVKGGSRETGAEVVEKVEENRNLEINENIEQVSTEPKVTSGSFDEVIDKPTLDKMMENAPKNVQDHFTKWKDGITFGNTELDTPHFNVTEGVVVDLKKCLSSGVNGIRQLVHECSHNIDHLLHYNAIAENRVKGKYQDSTLPYSYSYGKNKFGKAIKQDVENKLQEFYNNRKTENDKARARARELAINEFNASGTKDFMKMMGLSDKEIANELDALISKKEVELTKDILVPGNRRDLEQMFANEIKKNLSLEERGYIADAFEGCFEELQDFPFGIGHGSKYWKQAEHLVNEETFAGMYSASCVGEKYSKIVKEMLPSAYEVFEKELLK